MGEWGRMSNSSFRKYRVYLNVGRNGAEVEIIVSVWKEEHIEDTVEHLYGDRVHFTHYEEIDNDDSN